MAEEEQPNLLEQLKSRGLTCSKIKSLENKQRKDASEFRKLGFTGIAASEEQTAEKLKELRNKVCLLR